MEVAANLVSFRLPKLMGLLLSAILTSGLCYADTDSPETKDGIKVWKIPALSSDFVGFKAQTTLDAPLNSVVATIMDTPNAAEWIPNTGFIQVIDRSQMNQGKAKLYYLIDMPFPLADRDLVINSRLSKDALGKVRIDNEITTDKRYPPKDGIVRITRYSGSWLLEPIGPKSTRVTLQGDADPGGVIPAWATNLFVTKQPTDMLKNMREQVKKKRYESYMLPFENY